MKILRTLNDAARENTYYLVNEEAVLLIDPGSNGDDILAQLKEINKPIAAILLTHTHYDHIIRQSMFLKKRLLGWAALLTIYQD